MENELTFGQWVQKRRKALDLTREELAGKIGSSVSALRKIEADERRPSKQLAELLAEALEIPETDKAVFLRIARGGSPVEQLVLSPSGRAFDLFQSPPKSPKPIPIPLTPLIGREIELASLRQMLANPQCRLVTLLGPGGSGKTRMALEIATELSGNFRDGVCFVPLAGVGNPAFIAPNMAEYLNFSFSGSLDPREQLLLHLESKNIFLVLDNFEQLLGGVDLLAELLGQAPHIKLLVTSRERLNLAGEWVFEVQGLRSPGNDQQAILSYDAAALFIDSARRASLRFSVTPDQIPAIASICNLVQGMPLGIELAATWVRTLSCQEIAQEVERNFDFLAAPMHGIPDRHRSMRAAFDHSWNLLSEAERSAFHQLSVFRSGFQREAAKQVTGADLPLLSALLDKSLIRRTPEGRYEIHELLRQYAEAKRSERFGELETARDRHSSYYAQFVERLHGDLISARQMEALAETSAEMDNIRAAWQHAVENKALVDIHRFIRGLWQFYEIRGWFKEGEATFKMAIDHIKDWPALSRQTEPDIIVLEEFVRAHYIWFSMRLGRWGEAVRLAQDCVSRLRSLEAWAELAAVLHMAGVALWGTGRYAEARALLEEKIALEAHFENPWDLAMGWGQLGLVAQGMGDYQHAREYMSRAHALVESCGDSRMIAVSFYHRAGIEYDLGEFATARNMLEKSLEVSAIVGDRWIMTTSRLQLGLVSQAQGDNEQAVRWLQESIGFFQETGEYRSRVQAFTALGTSLLALNDTEGAEKAFHEALAAAQEAELWPEATETLVGFSHLFVKQGEIENALVTLDQATRHPSCSQGTRDRAMGLRQEIESQLTSKQIQDARQRAETTAFNSFVGDLLVSS